jgi:hypothetical protein
MEALVQNITAQQQQKLNRHKKTALPFKHLSADQTEEERIKRAAAEGKPKPATSSSSASLWLVVALAGMGGVEFSVVLPSMWQYVTELTAESEARGELGGLTAIDVQLYAQAIFLGSSMLSKLLLSTLASCVPLRPLFAVGTFFGATGGFFYAIAYQLGGVHALLLARLLGGGANAASTLANVYVVRSVRDQSER